MAALGLACCAWAFSSCSGKCSTRRFSLGGLLSLRSSGAWASEAVVRGPGCPVASSPARRQTRVPGTGRQVPNHWTTREVLRCIFTASLGHKMLGATRLHAWPEPAQPASGRLMALEQHCTHHVSPVKQMKGWIISKRSGLQSQIWLHTCGFFRPVWDVSVDRFVPVSRLPLL